MIQYEPGPAKGAEIRRNGEEKWTLILVRELHHAPEKVWKGLTDPAHLREWAPFDADGNLGLVGAKVHLTTVGAPTPSVIETTVTPLILQNSWSISGETTTFGGNCRLWILELA